MHLTQERPYQFLEKVQTDGVTKRVMRSFSLVHMS